MIQKTDHDLLVKKIKYKHALRTIWQGSIKLASFALPFKVRRNLARRSTRLGYLMTREGELTIDDYLGSLSVTINANTDTGRAMLTGIFEALLLKTIEKRVSRGNTCIDIGANVGAVSLALSQKVGPTGQVICFEPGPNFFQSLVSNYQKNSDLNKTVSLHNLGLSDKEGELLWFEDENFPGNAWLLGKKGTPVEVVTLDGFLETHPIDRLDFIKVDVEGMEWEVLKGAEKTLKTFHPMIAVETTMEFETIRDKKVRKHLQDFLHGLGYKLFLLPGNETSPEVVYPNFQDDSLAIWQANQTGY